MVLKIQDKEYLLKYDVNSLVLLEELSGMVLDVLLNNLGFKALREMLYVGLRKHHKEITLEGAGDLIQDFINEGQECGILGDLLLKAFQDSNLISKKKV